MHRYAPIPRFPAIERDIAVVVEEEAEAGALLECIRTNGGEYLEDAALFDIYRSEALGEQKKSMAFSVRFRSSEGTLAEEQITASMEQILAGLKEQFGAELRA